MTTATATATATSPAYGVFDWTGTNFYPADRAIRVYKSEVLALRFAASHNLVARTVAITTPNHEG